MSSEVSKDSIFSLNKEVKKEGDVVKINQESNQNYQKVLKQISKHKDNYSSALRKITTFEENKNLTRRRRAVSSPKVLALSKDERTAVSEMYSGYDELDDSKSKLLSQLRQTEGETEKSSVIKSRPSRSSLSSTLSRFGWSSRDEIQIKSDRYQKELKKLTAENVFGWRDWRKSPWTRFFDKKEDFLKLVQAEDQARKALENYLYGKRWTVIAIPLGRSVMERIMWEKGDFEKDMEDSKAAVSMAVAAKILKWMNQWKTKALSN